MSQVGIETCWLTSEERAALQSYRAARRALEALGLIRSDRSTVGEIAEPIVCRALKLAWANSRVQAAYDARDLQGATYQIKARLVLSLKDSTSFDFTLAPAGLDYLVGCC